MTLCLRALKQRQEPASPYSLMAALQDVHGAIEGRSLSATLQLARSVCMDASYGMRNLRFSTGLLQGLQGFLLAMQIKH